MKFGSIVLAKNIFFSQAIEDMEEEFFKTQIHLYSHFNFNLKNIFQRFFFWLGFFKDFLDVGNETKIRKGLKRFYGDFKFSG